MAIRRTHASVLPKQGRVTRQPSTAFQLRQRPYVIQPFCIFPVLPGETLRSATMQNRVVTDPLKNRFLGWWDEYYYFYVKHRDLQETLLETMMLDQDTDLSSLETAAKVSTYHGAEGIDWVSMCLDRIVEEYFRDEDDATSHTLVTEGTEEMPIASISQQTWLDSVIPAADYTALDVVIDDNEGTTDVTASQVDARMRMWEYARLHGLTDMDYEDYLGTFGIRVDRVEQNVPEVLRYIRKWQYPSNVIDPTDGSAASAVSWGIADKIDKQRFFREPGFVFGVHVVRPKVYLSGQKGSATTLLNDAFSWLPALMRDDPLTSLQQVPDVTGPLGDVTDANGYWVDIKDLFMYGEQFLNFALTATDAGLVALPTAGMNKRYVTSADVDALFASASPANKVHSDGIVTLTIAGTLTDTTPPTSRQFV